MDKIKKGLGRGLSSLIGETKVETQKNQLPVSDLIPNKYQPRKNFDETNLEDLTNSIKERGIIQPIIVRKSDNENSKFEIIAGERRWLAAQRAGIHTVPVVITDVDDLKSLEFAIVENVQRHDLNPLEEAQGYKRLIDEFFYDQEKVSKFIGKSRSYITNSIKERGIIQPIIVRKSNDENSKFEIIAGERRWLAAQRAGIHNVPVVITEADDLKSLEFAIVENVQRHDLNPLEEAQGYKRLIDEFSYDQEKVAKFIGKSRSYITNSLRILTLPNEVIKLIETQKLSTGHAKILVGLENASFVANKIIEKKLSVRQAENFVQLFKKKRQKSKITKDANIIALELSVSNKIGLNVEIQNNKRNKGKISFEYKDLDQLNKIIDIIKSNY